LQNLFFESVVVICEGSEFQAEGPTTQNALSASFVLVLGTTKLPRDTERKRSSLQALDSVEYQRTQLVHKTFLCWQPVQVLM